jgi:hypothetical protein
MKNGRSLETLKGEIIMEKQGHGKKVYGMIGLVILTLFIFSNISMAVTVTSDLTITPTPCRRGSVLHFSVTVYNNPCMGMTPGATYNGNVSLDNSTAPELTEWHSENWAFQYPTAGHTVKRNFTATYKVPQDLKGNTICFYMVAGTNIISYKHCIQVKPTIKLQGIKQPVQVKQKPAN